MIFFSEPDKGMKKIEVAQKYFRQLINGLVSAALYPR
jgi:hypothetical protein